MQNGRIALDDTPKRVFSHVEQLKEIGLDVPQVTELFFRLKNTGVQLPDDIITVEEAVPLLLNLLKEN